MLQFHAEYSFDGLWTIYENEPPVSGTFTFNQDIGGKLHLIFDSVRFKEEIVEFSYISGVYFDGPCTLIDCFIEEYSRNTNLVTVDIFVNFFLSGLSRCSENDKIFKKSMLRLEHIYKYLSSCPEFGANTGQVFKECHNCGSNLLHTSDIIAANVQIENANITFHLQESGRNLSSIQEYKSEYDCIIYIEFEENENLSNHIKVVNIIKKLFMSFLNCQIPICNFNLITDSNKKINSISLIYKEYMIAKNTNFDYFYSPIKVTSREDLEFVINKANLIYEECRQFFYSFEDIKYVKEFYEEIIASVRFIESSYRIYKDISPKKKYTNHDIIIISELKDILKKSNFSKENKEFVLSHFSRKRVSLKDKLNFVVEYAINKYGMPHPVNYKNMISDAVEIRDIISHGDYIKDGQFNIRVIEHIPTLFFTSLYVLYMDRIGIDERRIKIAIYRLLRSYMGIWWNFSKEIREYF